MRHAFLYYFGALGVTSTLLTGCQRPSQSLDALAIVGAPKNSVATKSVAKKTPPTRATKRKANLKGVVFVAEYHHIGYNKSNMFRTPEQFAKDLKRLYDLGFRPVTASEYLNNKMQLPPGASPVVMTFDDSQPSQIRLLPDGSLDPKCAMGIWQAFARKHPDFPLKATFFVLPRMWDQPPLRRKKVAMVKEWGSELGNHTVHHPVLRIKDDETVKAEIAGGNELLEKYGFTDPPMFAMPYGSNPKNRSLLKQFRYNGRVYKLGGAFLVGSNPAPYPTSPKLRRTAVPRIIAQPGNLGLDYWLDRVEKGEVKPYVAP